MSISEKRKIVAVTPNCKFFRIGKKASFITKGALKTSVVQHEWVIFQSNRRKDYQKSKLHPIESFLCHFLTMPMPKTSKRIHKNEQNRLKKEDTQQLKKQVLYMLNGYFVGSLGETTTKNLNCTPKNHFSAIFLLYHCKKISTDPSK